MNTDYRTDSPEILFARLDINEVMERVNELHPPVKEEAPAEPVREEVKAAQAAPASAPVAAAPKAESNDSVLVLTKRVITERDIREAAAKHYKKVQLPEKPVITYLAKDTAFELGIELI